VSDGAFRVLFSGIFLVAGVGHFVQADVMVRRLVEAPFGSLATAIAPAGSLIFATGIVLIAGGALLAVGYATRIAALALIGVLIPITVTVHFGGGPEHMGPLFKNVALLGGLVHFAIRGPGSWSLDPRA
jgi:putative oxidoreductase